MSQKQASAPRRGRARMPFGSGLQDRGFAMMMSDIRRGRLALCAALPLLTLPLAARASTFATATDSVFLTYAGNVAGGQLIGSPQLNVGFNSGGSHVFTMDTGSTGIVVTPDTYTYAQGATPGPAGQIVYTSSGKVLNGHYYDSTVVFGGGGHTATASVPVLVVDSISCVPNARDCTPNANPTGVAMFGVGFGQEGSGQPQGTPDKNPFLNITQIDGNAAAPSKGYLVTSTGVSVGLTAANTAQFAPSSQVGLTWSNTLNDWERTPIYTTAGGITGPGTLLPDTGVQYMYLTPYTGANVQTIADGVATYPCTQFGPCAAPGQTITIAIGTSQQNPAFTYSITIAPGTNGAPIAQPIAPEWVTVLQDASQTFVNTSYHFYNAVNYAYDSTNGVVGFVSTIPVPEPMSGLLFGTAALGLLGLSRRAAPRA